MKLRKQHKSAASLPGFKDLRPEDKFRVANCIGWSEEAQDTSDTRNSNHPKDPKASEPALGPLQQGRGSRKSTAEIDSTLLMKLELEDKEAEARLAEAELLLAETRVKVETARRAVSAQKLKMAQAGVVPTP
ncbi:hypothetical protein M407DRAFT_31131 [Tulasnella calospora MUT 4182]|uniref:Uncharacterized protein n=1 Tax=Tulasnella calospora MUT 4182 TaxID=1051891 RepID=A0A0C3Q661_9AGAM|nr:hypothetical protein M407DRAFT_31131 [Tulasnella calospora MUT 4182]